MPNLRYVSEQERVADIIQIQRRTPYILSEMEQRSVKVSTEIQRKGKLSLTEIQQICGYKFRSGAAKLADRFVKEFPHKYEIIKGSGGRDSTYLKLKDDYQRIQIKDFY